MRHRLRRIFITGLLASFPLVVTLFLLSWLFNKLDRLSPLVTHGLIALGLPLRPGFRIPGLGILFTIGLIFIVGLSTTTLVGRWIVQLAERLMNKISILRTIYGSAKQAVDAVGTKQTLFRQVVVVEFPRRDLFSVGFITCDYVGELQETDKRRLVYVFIPSTPIPLGGFLIVVPWEEVIPLSMTTEDGMKLIMSGGILSPEAT